MARRITAADMTLSYRYGDIGSYQTEDIEELDEGFGALFPAAQNDSVGLWASTIPAPFDDLEDDDEYGMEWSYDAELYGADDASDIAESGIGISEDLTDALETAGGKIAQYRPGMALTAQNVAEIGKITGSSLEKAKNTLSKMDEIASAVGLVLGSPWSWIILGSVVGTALSIELVIAIKKRRSSRGAMIEFAEENGVPEASNFISFAIKASKMDPNTRTLVANRLSKKLDKRQTSDRKREEISARLKILAAFQLVDATEEEDSEAQAEIGRAHV